MCTVLTLILFAIMRLSSRNRREKITYREKPMVGLVSVGLIGVSGLTAATRSSNPIQAAMLNDLPFGLRTRSDGLVLLRASHEGSGGFVTHVL